MPEIGIADAARNNAAWCDAVCSAHGAPGELRDSHWLTRLVGYEGGRALAEAQRLGFSSLGALRVWVT